MADAVVVFRDAAIAKIAADADLVETKARADRDQRLASQKAIAQEIQLQAMQDVPYVPAGQYFQPVAYRKNLTGMLNGVPVFTNLRKG